MIQKISQVCSTVFNPYHNLALEKYLFDHVGEDEIILYLWQNERTVVCGRNQNLWKECRVTKLLEDGGHPVRRTGRRLSVLGILRPAGPVFAARQGGGPAVSGLSGAVSGG